MPRIYEWIKQKGLPDNGLSYQILSVDELGTVIWKDNIINWNDIINKPTSSVTDIDDAVNKKHNIHLITDVLGLSDILATKANTTDTHSHTDLSLLQSFSDIDGILHYNGNPITANFNPGETGSDVVLWSHIFNKPIATVIDIDDAVSKKHQHTNQNLLDIINVDENNNPTWDNKSWPVSVGYVDVKKINSRSVINNETLGVVLNVEQWMINNMEQLKTLYSSLFIVLKNNSIIDDAIVRFTYADNTFVEVAVNPNDDLNTRITKTPKLISIQGNVEYDINGSFVYNTTNISKQRTLKKVTMNVNVISLDFFEVFSILQFIEDNINSNDYYIDCMIKIFPTDLIFLKTKNDIQEYTTEFTMNSIVSNTYSQTEFFAKGNGLITFEITWID